MTGRYRSSAVAAAGAGALLVPVAALTGCGEPAGLAVTAVTANGPSARAGLQAGDVITAVDGQQTATMAVLTAVLATLKPDEKVPVAYIRSGSSHTADVTLGSLSS
jgi:putative serine protease PepD